MSACLIRASAFIHQQMRFESLDRGHRRNFSHFCFSITLDNSRVLAHDGHNIFKSRLTCKTTREIVSVTKRSEKKLTLPAKMCASNASAMNLMGDTGLCDVILLCTNIRHRATYSIALTLKSHFQSIVWMKKKNGYYSATCPQAKSQQTIYNEDRSINPKHS